MGADGITLPHVENLDQGRQAVSLFADARANVWSPANPTGTVIAMLMLEDPRAVAQASADRRHRRLQRARLRHRQPDRRAQRRPRGGREAGNQEILVETKRVKLVNMLTADARTSRSASRKASWACWRWATTPTR